MDKPLPISVAVVAHNEEESLARCLESVAGLAAEIVVIDSGSTDRTQEIARRFNSIFEVRPWPGFVQQKNHAFSRCSQPWVLNLDADEVVSPELAQSIRELFAHGEPREDGFLVNRRTFYLGEWIWHAWYPEWLLRLGRRTETQWHGLEPHATMQVAGATRRLKGDLLHYSFRDFSDHLHRTIRYARIMAESYARQGRRFHWYQLVFSPWLAFFKHLLLRQGWRDGWRGWLIASAKWFDVFAKYGFLLERELMGRGSDKK
jgi:glycosyltransferase involved in cell wall biosynthesis